MLLCSPYHLWAVPVGFFYFSHKENRLIVGYSAMYSDSSFHCALIGLINKRIQGNLDNGSRLIGRCSDNLGQIMAQI